ncbi:hypothetical protein Poly24_27300 [Rosistilla carotiformis]|uniref:Uncharacterized protein n=1 Tax=Rosistilla carotiformis TaxID=2528017 RepID=A0A518JU57_9BACT|nr:hypothetical protein [Rosistilla carotiformis]QDV69016.1 hypothetical protein Poly24_27300 [Rosistilla carotiformis]
MRRFDFSDRWRKQIVPLLDDLEVVLPLTLGMKLLTMEYQAGDPPCSYGDGEFERRRPREGCLSWYQPRRCCHNIAPFCWAIGRKLYPNLNWGFVSSNFHTVVVGYDYDWQKPRWLMDILLFQDHTPEESLELVKIEEWKFHATLPEYFASFAADPDKALKIFKEQAGRSNRAFLSA